MRRYERHAELLAMFCVGALQDGPTPSAATVIGEAVAAFVVGWFIFEFAPERARP